MTTPNMGLIEPTPGVGGTPGPQWASESNENWETIDAHDHSSGKGAPIASASIGINADLPFNGYSATQLLSTKFNSQVASSGFPASLQTVNGELTYVDSLGQVVTITANGSVAGATGSISGLSSPASAVYSSVTKSFTWSFDSAKAARMANADLILYPYDGLTAFTNSITIKAPTTLAAAYSVTLPGAVPANPNVVSMSGAGVLSTGLADGTLAAPSLAFTNDLDTGLRLAGSNRLGFVLGGIQPHVMSTTQILTVGAAASAPSYSFEADADTGMYQFAANELGFAAGGVAQMAMRFSYVRSMVPHRFENGSAGVPSLSFETDSNTGFYRLGAGQIAVSLAGTARTLFVGDQIQQPFGTAGAPAFAFGSQTNMGMYRSGSNVLSFATAGDQQFSITGIGGQWYEAGSGQGEIRWKLFSGAIAGGGSVTLTSPSTAVFGVLGNATRGGTTNWVPITSFNATTSGGIAVDVSWNAAVNDNSATITNSAGSSRNYRVVMIYQ